MYWYFYLSDLVKRNIIKRSSQGFCLTEMKKKTVVFLSLSLIFFFQLFVLCFYFFLTHFWESSFLNSLICLSVCIRVGGMCCERAPNKMKVTSWLFFSFFFFNIIIKSDDVVAFPFALFFFQHPGTKIYSTRILFLYIVNTFLYTVYTNNNVYKNKY